MESIHRLCWSHSQRLIPLSLSISSAGAGAGALIHSTASNTMRRSCPSEIKIVKRLVSSSAPRARSRLRVSAAGWFSGFAAKKSVLPEIVKAGDPVLHEPAREVAKGDIGSEKIEKIIEDMISVMREGPGVGLAATQIGVPLKIIVLEDTKEYISYARPADIEAQDRRPFDLLVIINPKLRNLSNKKAIFFEGCLSVDGFRAAVERYLEVEVSGLGRDGRPIKLEARGWQARIVQHECDHLNGTLYVDKMMKKTFRTVENLELPLPAGCPPLGVR